MTDVVATKCTADRFGWHDYSEPPHTTVERPRIADHDNWDECWSQSHWAEPRCAHTADYELVIYQIGSHEWIWACRFVRTW